MSEPAVDSHDGGDRTRSQLRLLQSRPLPLDEAAARVISLAQHGDTDAALAVAGRALADVRSAPPTEQAGLWYATAVAHQVAGDLPAVVSACEHCVLLALESDNPGWASIGLSMRAIALIRQGRMEPALLDLARAEAELDRCEDTGLRCWAHTRLGYCYLDLRLYELAQPHLEQARQIDARPISLREAAVIDLQNLVELHMRWAEELERARPREDTDAVVDRHRDAAHAYAEQALAAAHELEDASLVAVCRAMELYSRPRGTAEASLAELRAAFANEEQPDYQGSRAAAGGALARALWALGRRQEAIEVAREAVSYSESANDWQVGASARWLLVEMQAQAGVPGATAGRAYGQLLSGVLWRQRLSTLQGAKAALQVERLRRDHLAAQRAAFEDPLTGLGNRRALDDALQTVHAEAVSAGGRRAPDAPVSLLMVDLNDFKQVNDTYGHVAGDEVLRAVARSIRGVARSDDLVARLGGDEFVVLARGADAATGRRLADRVSRAIDSLTVGTSQGAITLGAAVGVATVDSGHDVATLLGMADAEMYAVKSDGRPR